jgi:hypothetical protein
LAIPAIGGAVGGTLGAAAIAKNKGGFGIMKAKI